MTFHTKGIWYKQVLENHTEYMTIIGSSNYGNRSKHKDLEAQFWIFTSNEDTLKEIEHERQSIVDQSRPITLEEIDNDPIIKNGIPEYFFYWIFKNSI